MEMICQLLPESSVSATYNRAGNYEVTVFVFDANGLSSYATTRINIDARLDTRCLDTFEDQHQAAAAWNGHYNAIQAG